VIVRVFEARIVPGAEAEFQAALRDDIAVARGQPGLQSLRWGRRIENGETHVIVVSEWSDIDALSDWLGPNYLLPRFAAGEAALVNEPRVRHYEGLER
jgi:heme-degrading monooxygenase HmoA